MRIIEIKNEPPEKATYFVNFSNDEERDLADTILGLLSEPAFRGADRDFLEEVYWHHRCTSPRRLWAEQLDQTMTIIETWEKRGWFPCTLPAFLNANLDIEETDSSMFKEGKDDAITSLLLIWQQAWETHRPRLILISDEYRTFPGNHYLREKHMLLRPDPELERAGEYEERFWAEVERVKDTSPLGWNESYQYVRDYMKRGRDVIPRVLMRHWTEFEKVLPEVIPGAQHEDEDWVTEAIEYSRMKESFLSKRLPHAK